jgi:hypothetical protein
LVRAFLPNSQQKREQEEGYVAFCLEDKYLPRVSEQGFANHEAIGARKLQIRL